MMYGQKNIKLYKYIQIGAERVNGSTYQNNLSVVQYSLLQWVCICSK